MTPRPDAGSARRRLTDKAIELTKITGEGDAPRTWAPGQIETIMNEAEDPHMPISMIMCDGMAFCETGEDIKPVAKITVTKM